MMVMSIRKKGECTFNSLFCFCCFCLVLFGFVIVDLCDLSSNSLMNKLKAIAKDRGLTQKVIMERTRILEEQLHDEDITARIQSRLDKSWSRKIYTPTRRFNYQLRSSWSVDSSNTVDIGRSKDIITDNKTVIDIIFDSGILQFN